uniref:USP domain-containing protein n=1 Tax=Panagrolaimus sp. ES5 TaxID=591445 RepID=A0AC34GKN6_9BILA
MDVRNKRYNVPIPWILPLRILEFPFLRQLTPEKIEEFPLVVDVFNYEEVIRYKLGFISFALPGHYAALIPTKNGWLLYDGMKDPEMFPLREAVSQITKFNGTINSINYFIKELPKAKTSNRKK